MRHALISIIVALGISTSAPITYAQPTDAAVEVAPAPDGPMPTWAGHEAATVEAPAPVTAPTPPAVDPESPLDLAGQLVTALRSGAYFLAFALGLLLAVFLARRVLSRWIAFFASRKGGYVLNLAGAFAATLATAALAGAQPSLTLIGGALAAAFTAAGGWQALTDRWPSLGDASVSPRARES